MAVQSRSTNTSKGRLDTKSKHPTVAFNVAEPRRFSPMTWKSWSVNGTVPGQSAANSCVDVQESNWEIPIKTNENEHEPHEPGGKGPVTTPSMGLTNTSVTIHPDESVLEKSAKALVPWKREIATAHAVEGRARAAARVKAKITATNFIAFLTSGFCRDLIFDIIFILVSSLIF